MYKAIIIDDEEAIRTGLRDHFDWERHGVTVTEIFPDCAKAYAYVCDHVPDLVITDVYTPYMDGITFAKRLHEEFPSIQIVFVSGHADVQLLRQALKTDAFDYILKSVDLNELSVTITRVVQLMDQKNREKQRVMAMEDQLKELLPLYKERLLQSFLDGDADFSTANYLGLELDDSAKYVCLVIRLNNKWIVCKGLNGAERLALSIDCERICNEAIHDHPGSVSFKKRMSEYIVILKYDSSDYEQDVLEISTRIQKSLMLQLSFEVSIGISQPYALLDFKFAYEEACGAIEQRYYLAEDSSIAVAKYTEVPDQKEARELAERYLPDAILSGDPAKLETVLNQAFALTRTMTDEERDNFTLFLLMLPPRNLSGLKARKDSPYRNQRQLVEHWLSCPSYVEQEQFLRQIMEETASLLQDNSESGTSTIIRRIESIISEQYMDQISVASLANQVHLTPTYLCVLFKQATGKTINEYLTSERIRQAKILLRDPDVKLYDVCYRVGYLSPSYFSKLFKKQVGMPPGEYRIKAQTEPSAKEG